jgi:hypothetical protein
MAELLFRSTQQVGLYLLFARDTEQRLLATLEAHPTPGCWLISRAVVAEDASDEDATLVAGFAAEYNIGRQTAKIVRCGPAATEAASE